MNRLEFYATVYTTCNSALSHITDSNDRKYWRLVRVHFFLILFMRYARYYTGKHLILSNGRKNKSWGISYKLQILLYFLYEYV